MADVAALLNRGMHLLKAGQLSAAEQEFLGALSLDSENSHALFALGIIYYQWGRLGDAERYLSRSIAGSPAFLPAYNNLGLVYKARGEPERGMAILRRALVLQPGYVDALYNLALMQEEGGDRPGAIESYRRAIELNADFLPAQTNLGLLLRASGDAANAFPHLASVAERLPRDVSAHINLALVLTDLARYAEAVEAGARATQLAPNNFSAWEALGNAQRLGGDASNAIPSLEQACLLNPASVELKYELGLAQNAAGEIEAGRKTLDAVARARPDWLKVWFARDLVLPPLYASDQHIADCQTNWAAAIGRIEARLADDAGGPAQKVIEAIEAIAGYAPFYLHYQGLDNTALQRRFGSVVTTIARRAWPQASEPAPWKPLAHGGRLKIGFISAYLRRHSVGNFFGNWICQLDAGKFESSVWYTGEASDAVSEKIRRRAEHYTHTGFDIPALAVAIRARRLDVLVYLDVGMHPHAQVLAALHLAPIQCATFGNPVTTGIESIGYFLSADAAEPDNAGQHYSEQLIRLPRFAVSYARPDISMHRAPPALAGSRRPLLLCPQPLFKILPHFDRLAARIAHALPGCRLAFIQSMWPQVNEAFRSRIGAALRNAGVDPATTLKVLPVMAYEDYLGALAAADVVLDTPGFSGGNSSFDAIAIGAPIVTWRGEMLRGRQTAAMLDIVGLTDLATQTDDDYVSNVIGLATSRERRRDVSERMKSASAALFDDGDAVAALEKTLMELATKASPA